MKTPNKTSRSPWLLIATTLLAVGLLPFLTGAERGSAQYENNREEIAAMSAIERARLDQKFKQFTAKTPAQRQKLTAFHRDLESDPALGKTLVVYQKWLQTLDPWERDELRKEKDLAKRMSLVRKFKGDSSPDGLNAEDLAAVMEVIEKSTSYKSEDSKKLNTTEPPARYLVVLSGSFPPSSSRQRGGPPETSPRPPPKMPRWLTGSLLTKVIDVISDDELRDRLETIEDDGDQRQTLVKAILVGLDRQFKILRDQNKPSQQDLDKFFVQLEGSERDRLMQMSPREMKHQLELKYILFKQKPDSEPRANRFEFYRQYGFAPNRLRSAVGLPRQFGGRSWSGPRGEGGQRPSRGGGDRSRSRSQDRPGPPDGRRSPQGG